MGDLNRHAIILSLIKAMSKMGSWCGETHIQKSVFFLQNMLDVPLEFDFVLYKHGPFSFDLRDELEEMRANQTLSLKSQPYPYGPSYVVGELSNVLEKRYPKTSNRYRTEIDFIAENISNKTVAELERISTAFFVIQDSSYSDASRRIRRIIELKPHVKELEAEEALKTVEYLLKQLSC